MAIPTTSGEMFLAGWRETHSGGFVASFIVDAEIEARIRRGTVAKGKIAGQRYAVVIVELGPDEKPVPDTAKATKLSDDPPFVAADKLPPGTQVVDQPRTPLAHTPPKKKAHFPEGLTGLAVMWCADEHFQHWLSTGEFANLWAGTLEALQTDDDEAISKSMILDYCGISSRKELNTDEIAAATFTSDILQPYRKQRAEDGIDSSSPNPF